MTTILGADFSSVPGGGGYRAMHDPFIIIIIIIINNNNKINGELCPADPI